MRDHAMDDADGPGLADRLALTSADRRMESLVLMQILHSSTGSGPPAPAGHPEVRGGSFPAEASTYAHALNLASFLSAEYGLETPAQKAYACELAVELARRVSEDLGEIIPPSPRDSTA